MQRLEPTDYKDLLNKGSGKLADFLHGALFGDSPALAVVAGSGLGHLADGLTSPKSLDFKELGLPVATAEGHSGQFVAGRLDGAPVLIQKGRIHMYEGHSGVVAALPMRMMLGAGIKRAVVTNAAGALAPDLNVGELVLISAFDLRALTPDCHPSTGLSGDGIGSQFYAPAFGFSNELMERLQEIAKQEGITLHPGQYVFRYGPNYEDPSDIWSLYKQRLGLIADGKPEFAPASIGMSTVAEFLAIAQWNAGVNDPGNLVQAAYISNLTNPGAGLSDIPPNHQEVLENSKAGGERLSTLIGRLVG